MQNSPNCFAKPRSRRCGASNPWGQCLQANAGISFVIECYAPPTSTPAPSTAPTALPSMPTPPPAAYRPTPTPAASGGPPLPSDADASSEDDGGGGGGAFAVAVVVILLVLGGVALALWLYHKNMDVKACIDQRCTRGLSWNRPDQGGLPPVVLNPVHQPPRPVDGPNNPRAPDDRRPAPPRGISNLAPGPALTPVLPSVSTQAPRQARSSRRLVPAGVRLLPAGSDSTFMAEARGRRSAETGAAAGRECKVDPSPGFAEPEAVSPGASVPPPVEQPTVVEEEPIEVAALPTAAVGPMLMPSPPPPAAPSSAPDEVDEPRATWNPPVVVNLDGGLYEDVGTNGRHRDAGKDDGNADDTDADDDGYLDISASAPPPPSPSPLPVLRAP